MNLFGDMYGLFIVVGAAALAAIWFFVPFAIFGTKSKLDDLIDELEKTNKHLAEIKASLTRDKVMQGDTDIPSIRASR